MLRGMLKTAELPITLLLGVFLASGCAYGNLKQVLRAQVAAETSCGDVTIEATPLYQPGHKPNQYRVKGCGVDRTYNCPKEDGLVSYGDDQICSYVDTKSIKMPEAQTAPGQDQDQDQDQAQDPMMDPAMDEPMDESAAEPLPADDAAPLE
jgi:hypothetical protein